MFGKLGAALKNLDSDKVAQLMANAQDMLSPARSNASTLETTSPQENSSRDVYQTKKTRALLVGINYTGQQGELRGCINDVGNVKQYLDAQSFGETRILTDDPQCPTKPTRQNMIEGMRWLVSDASPGDCFFFHYSGHGAHQQDTSTVANSEGDEADGQDETLCPLDYATAGMLVDDEIHELLVKPLPKGCKLTAIFDCCHSGSGMDLPFTYSVDGKSEIVMRDNRKEALKAGMEAGKAFLQKDHQRALQEAFKAVSLLAQPKQAAPDDAATAKMMAEKLSPADILMFSGCMDTQTSADAHIEGSHTGAMSWALLKVLRENNELVLTDLLRKLREVLYGKYQQIPQMSTGHQMPVATIKFQLTH